MGSNNSVVIVGSVLVMLPLFQAISGTMPLQTAEKEKVSDGEEEESLSFLDACSALELSEYLMEHRFSDDPAAAASFLQAAFNHAERTSAAVIEHSQEHISGEFQTPLLLEEMETSFMTPRMGKVKIQLAGTGNKGGLLATKISVTNANQQQQLHVPKGSVSHVIVFPKPEDCKLIRSNRKSEKQRVPKAHLVLIKLKVPVKFQGKDIDQLCFGLPWRKTHGPTGPKLVDADEDETADMGWQETTAAWRNVLTKALRSNDDQENSPMTVTQVRVDNSVFTSHMDTSTSTTTSGMPYVGCNLGVQDGVLYPLQQGLLFFKPPKFIPRSSLKDIIFGRGSSAGQSSNRYVDMAVVLKEDESNLNPKKLNNNNNVEEFTNIQGQEQGALQEYKEHFLTPYLKKENQESDDMDTDDEDDAKAEEVEDDSEDDDDSFVEGEDDAEHDEESDDDDSDTGGIQVVNDDFAEELARKRKGEDSVTESEDDASSTSASPRKKRYSKRLRRPR